jgi:Fic family protein
MPPYIWERTGWTQFRWNNDRILVILGECRLLQGKLLGKVADLGFNLGPQAEVEILAEEVMKTAAIEGESLATEAVRSTVAGRLALAPAGLRGDRYVDGLVSVLLDATRNFDKPLTRERLFGWHAALFPNGYAGMQRVEVGQWRGARSSRVIPGHPGGGRVRFQAPPADRIAGEMRRFLEWWEESRGRVEGLLRAAIAHFRFVTIHPFDHGNGRIARALTDMALSEDGRHPVRYYSISSQIMEEKNEYDDVLERCRKGNGDITEWLRWFLGCFSRSIQRSEMLLAGVLDKAAFWKTYVHAPLSDRQRKVINQMLDFGQGGFDGAMTTRKYVSLANVSRATAFRELNHLLELGIIKQNQGGGRSVSYDLTWLQLESKDRSKVASRISQVEV